MNEKNTAATTAIITELERAYQRGIKIFLYSYRININNPYNTHIKRGRRWLYQVEGNYDFQSSATGEDGWEDPNFPNSAEPHWSEVKVNEFANNKKIATKGTHNLGYLVSDLKPARKKEIPDGTSCYLKIRARVPDGTPINPQDAPVCSIIVRNIDQNPHIIKSEVVRRNQLTNAWQEIQVMSFDKTPYGPTVVEENISSMIEVDSISMLLVPDYEYPPEQTYTRYDIEIIWLDNFSCEIDYIVIDDYESHKLHIGDSDPVIENTITNFMNKNGLGNFKIEDEPLSPQYYQLRYINNKIRSILYQHSISEKDAMAFHSVAKGFTTQEYLAATQMDILLSNIFPIPYYYPDSYDKFVKPGQSQYNEILQARFDDKLTSYLVDLIDKSQVFEKKFIFTPQVHSWDRDVDEMWCREPSAYEIKTMTNLGICYGAKGILYYIYAMPFRYQTGFQAGEGMLANISPQNPTPRYEDEYLYPKWETVKQLNYKLASIGDELLSLTWQKAYSIHLGQPAGEYITNIQSFYMLEQDSWLSDLPAAISTN